MAPELKVFVVPRRKKKQFYFWSTFTSEQIGENYGFWRRDFSQTLTQTQTPATPKKKVYSSSNQTAGYILRPGGRNSDCKIQTLTHWLLAHTGILY